VFPFPPSLFHGECNSTFLIFHLIYIPRIIWFTNFGSGGQYISLTVEDRTTPSSFVLHISPVSRPPPKILLPTPKHQLLSPYPRFPSFPKRNENFGWSETKNSPPCFLHFRATLFRNSHHRQIASFGIVSRNPPAYQPRGYYRDDAPRDSEKHIECFFNLEYDS